jgi:hypothetical protein
MIAVGCNQVLTDKYPLIEDITRVKEKQIMCLYVGDIINLEKEMFLCISARAVHVQPVQIEDVHANDLVKKQRVGRQTSDLCIVSSWNDG